MTEAPSCPQPREYLLWGYRLHPLTGEEVVDQISAAVASRRRLIMANLNLHGMATMYHSPLMTGLHQQADCLVMIDGMPILFLVNRVCGARLPYTKRTTSLDFYDWMFRLGAEQGWKFAYIGGEQSVLDAGLEQLRGRFPGLMIEGRNGYFDLHDRSLDSAGEEIVAWLCDRSPDVVVAGMGMPRQEEWISLVQNRVDARVFLPAGAYLDYQVGVQRPAPRWLGRYGLEGVYRFLHSPYRLGYRYLIEPVVLAWRIMRRKPFPAAPLSRSGDHAEAE